MIKIPLPVAVALALVTAFFSIAPAQATGTRAMMAIMAQMPAGADMATWTQYANAAAAVGPAYVDSFRKTCPTAAASEILSARTAQGQVLSYICQLPLPTETDGTQLVAVGDSGIADPDVATRNSPVYSGNTIREFGGNARKEFCRTDTDDVFVYCRALVQSTDAP